MSALFLMSEVPLCQGELKHEFVFAAESEAIMNVWMEVPLPPHSQTPNPEP